MMLLRDAPLGYYYRYDEVRYAPLLDEHDQPQGRGRLEVVLRKFEVLKHTPKGVWVNGWHGKRFVLHAATKRYADADLDKAKASFIARKEKQARIYRARAATADEAIAIIKGETLFSPFPRMAAKETT